MRHLLMPFLAATLFASLAPVAPATVVPIGDLHCNDASGRPKAPYGVGTPVSVRGVVTAGTGTFVATRTEVFVQDATGGIMIYKSSVPQWFAMGDSVTFDGTIDQYRGETEIVLTTWNIHASNRPLPQPRVMTAYQVAHEFGANYCEPEESMLIRLDRVTYSGTWANNVVVTLTDDTGSCDMYIDGDTGVGTIPPPQGHFSVIGVLKQFSGFSPPFNTGYEILPRMPSDIIPIPGPGIIDGPEEFNIEPTSVTIIWTTDVPASSHVDYGLTNAYELGSITDPTLVTQHSIALTGLSPALIHLYRVSSENGDGEISIPGLRFCSGSRSSGVTQVYFNKSVDASLALGEAAQGNINLTSVLVDRINAAQNSIDVALYSFDIQAPADALIAAHNRGVHIRFTTENRDTYQQQVLRLIQNGIAVIDDAYGPNNAGGGLMHDKFWVFDHRYDGDPANDWVLTGSWNVTSDGTYNDSQNIILVQDESMAEIYTAELNEMWGTTADMPDANQSRFGNRKVDDTPKKLSIAGHLAKVYFGPSDNTMTFLSSRISEASRSVHFCILSFTRFDVATAMQERYTNAPGFELRGVFDSAESGNTSSQYQNMKGTGTSPWDPPADVWLDTETGSLHHKYMIIDANSNGGRPTVLTGSSNWSTNANDSNDENIFMIEDFRVANLYFQEFAARYHAAGGSADLSTAVSDQIADHGEFMHLYPNPTGRMLTVSITAPLAGAVTLSLHDAGGRRLASRIFEVSVPGRREVSWDIGDRQSGTYFVRLVGAGLDAEERITLLR